MRFRLASALLPVALALAGLLPRPAAAQVSLVDDPSELAFGAGAYNVFHQIYNAAVFRGEYRFGDTRHILSDISALRALGWEPRNTPADSVSAYAEWLKGMDGLDGVLAQANERMRALGVVRRTHT